jgi:hypothetical protein
VSDFYLRARTGPAPKTCPLVVTQATRPQPKRKRPSSSGSAESLKESGVVTIKEMNAAVKQAKAVVTESMKRKLDAMRAGVLSSTKTKGGQTVQPEGYVTAATAKKMVEDACARLNADKKNW